MKKIVFCLIGVLLLGACKKDEQKPGIFITGSIVDPNTGEAVNNVAVVISENRIENGAYSSSFYPIDTVYSDDNGKYQIEITKNNTINYEFTLRKEGYFTKIIEENSDQFSTADENRRDFELFTKSAVVFNFKNIGNTESSDHLIFNKRTGKTDCAECCENGITEYTGSDVDVSYYCAANGASFMRYEYTLSSSDVNGYFVDSVFCPVNDTAVVNIDF